MSDRHWMPFHIGDYMTDTPDFTAAEHGAYLLLIMYYWKNGGLPKDEARIRKISKLQPVAWRRSRDLLRSKFGDLWSHKRIDFEIAKLEQKQRQNSANAKRKSAPRTIATAKGDNSSSKELSPSLSERAPARSLALEAPARSPAPELKFQREPDPYVIDDEDYARRMNPPVKNGQLTRLPE